jgi:pyruvate,water dikinase
MAYIEWLDSRLLPRAVVGGKAATLSELLAAGFTQPPGFALTAAAYRRVIAQNGLGAAAPETLAASLCEADLPHDLLVEIEQAYAELTLKGGDAVAVRSSAISEDGASASFAGLYESYLNVRGCTDVERSVLRCYASLWASRAAHYRRERAGGSDEAMAVIVMSLIDAEVSGVAFTAHPVTGARDRVLINASWGLGEAVVGGLVTPDSFLFEKSSLILLEREVFAKDLVVVPDEAGGTVEAAVSYNRAEAPCLTSEQAAEVAGLAIRVEHHFGVPQDIEFAFAKGHFYLLQARPITTLV